MNHPSDRLDIPIRRDWLARRMEPPLDPNQPIVDAHHHLFDRPGLRYLLDDYRDDLASGHDVRASVFIQARAMYSAGAPQAMKCLGETEFANGVRAMCAGGQFGGARVCAGIVAYADLCLGEAVRPVLEAHLARSSGHVRGIRHVACWDADPALTNAAYPTGETMLDAPDFRSGFAELARLGLSFDAWLFFHQIPKLTALARAFPEVPIVLDHCGGIVGIRRYSGRRHDVFPAWSSALRDLAGCPNVMVKLGGLGMRLSGFGFEGGENPPSSTDLAEAWRPWMECCIEIFGSGRCMFESNFPVDKGSYSYANGWNAMKRIAAGASSDETADLFWRSATRFYGLSGPGAPRLA